MTRGPLDGEVKQSLSLIAMTVASTAAWLGLGLLALRLFG
jgi:hypothetical protein